jgi:endonuclease V-like protein UPF0215 family
LKKESRILGISAFEKAGKEIAVIGVIFRGNQWLDGVIACHLQPRNPENVSVLARAILKCKQYSQLHAVILANEQFSPTSRIDVTSLSATIDRPIIAIVRKKPALVERKHQKRAGFTLPNYYRVKLSGKYLSVLATKLSLTETSEILSVACVKGSTMPEAVRVAKLIACHASDLHTFKLQRAQTI